MYNYGQQNINKADISSVTKVLKNQLITQGQEVKKFENNLGSYFGSKYVTVVSNGTAALHLIGLSLGWKKEILYYPHQLLFCLPLIPFYIVVLYLTLLI